jgi:urease accessory protein
MVSTTGRRFHCINGHVFLLEGVAMRRNLPTILIATVPIACLCSSSAEAHLNSTGMGPIYDGFLHFFSSPEDIIPVVALALFTGLRGPEYGRRALFLLPASWFIGCLLGAMAKQPVAWPLAAISFLVFGGLVAADARVSVRGTALLAVLLGIVHGWMNGSGVTWTGSVLAVYLGLVSGISILVALVSALVIQLRPSWTRIAVRVAGSWIVATGLSLIGWAARSR